MLCFVCQVVPQPRKERVQARPQSQGRRKNKDSYVAIWEEHEGTKLKFPPARYRTPIMMLPQRFSWVADRERPGIEMKHLGTFSELRTGIGFFRLRPDSRLEAGRQREAEIRYCIAGSFSYGGKNWGENTYMFIPPACDTAALARHRGRRSSSSRYR